MTFRMIWVVSHAMEGFMGTFTIILCLFYVLDLVQTWFRPERLTVGTLVGAE